MIFLLAQCIGFLSTLFFLLSFQFKEKKQLFLLQTFSYGVSVLHYGLLGAYPGSLGVLVSTLRSFILMKSEDKKWAQWKGWLPVIFLLYTIALLITWSGPISILPCAGTAAAAAACFTRSNRMIRIVNFCITSPFWIIYDIYCLSYIGIFNETLAMLSIIISVIRFGWAALDK